MKPENPKMPTLKTKSEAFWCKVKKLENGCWYWTGHKKGLNGYGILYWNYGQFRPHRVSYELFVREIPIGLEVCHDCDNQWCVNPEHLFVGTHKQNMGDMSRKAGQALEIKKLCEEGNLTQRQIAKLFGISQTLVWKISNEQKSL